MATIDLAAATATTCNRCHQAWTPPRCVNCGGQEYTIHHLPPINHPGGKGSAGIYQRLINWIPPHDVFIEAFAGGAALSRYKRPATRTVWLEIDAEYSAALSRVARAGRGIELWSCSALHWLPVMFALDLVQPQNPTPRDPRLPWSTRPSDASFVYCDPPYPASTKGERTYRHELTDDQHRQLLAIVTRLPCPVMVSCYPCALYDEALATWNRHEYQTTTRGGLRTEIAWTNYPTPPAELHDARFLGANKRERERIRRRVRNWTAGLQRMAPHERQAVLDALQENA